MSFFNIDNINDLSEKKSLLFGTASRKNFLIFIRMEEELILIKDQRTLREIMTLLK